MSYFDEQFHRLAGTEHWDSDTRTNLRVLQGRLGIRVRRPDSATLTPRERVARGIGTPEDLAELERQNEQHKNWLASETGRAWAKEAGVHV